jgi:hypothetical protein
VFELHTVLPRREKNSGPVMPKTSCTFVSYKASDGPSQLEFLEKDFGQSVSAPAAPSYRASFNQNSSALKFISADCMIDKLQEPNVYKADVYSGSHG